MVTLGGVFTRRRHNEAFLRAGYVLYLYLSTGIIGVCICKSSLSFILEIYLLAEVFFNRNKIIYPEVQKSPVEVTNTLDWLTTKHPALVLQ